MSPYKPRITVVMLACMAFGGLLASRAAFIQLGINHRLENMSRRQFQSRLLIQPSRGAILDRNGEALAINSEAQSIAVNPSKLAKIQNRRLVAHLLAKATELPYSRILEHISNKREFAWIKRHISDEDVARLRRYHILNSDGDPITGVWLVRESERVYPHGELAAHVVGGVNLDSEGKEGIELSMNERLRGKVISMSAIKDAYGRPAFIDVSTEGRDGEPVTLTIDNSLQFSVEEELRSAINKTGAKGGSVIVMNAVNGEILAMANAPSFNPNDRVSPADHRRNRALTDGYEPGSTMKPVLLASGLSKGMHLTDVVWGERGKFKLQGRTISEAEAHEKFEWLSLKKIITVSSNVGAAKLALKVGPDAYLNMLKAYGFGSKTGIDFPGEISGRVPPRKSWQPLTTANIGFGQGVLVTPIQMLRAYATFANGGWLVQPTLIKTPEKPEKERAAPKRVISAQVAAQVTEALESVTHKELDGTGQKAVLPGFRVAGKTGTAQKVDPLNGHYSRTKHIASFIGFPVLSGDQLRDTPRIVVYTMLDEPQGVYYAGETAAPLFREVLNAVANRFSLPASEPTDITPGSSQRQLAGRSNKVDVLSITQAHPAPVRVAPTVMEWSGKRSDGKSFWKMPNVEGLSVREAMDVFKGHVFQLEVRGDGVVTQQRPEAGHAVSDGDSIHLTLSDPD
ncbi:MAG: penicillin-binding protein [Oligoflexia bacterium]|nr:penicillin-binding protein [Oligoflexia bacterium]